MRPRPRRRPGSPRRRRARGAGPRRSASTRVRRRPGRAAAGRARGRWPRRPGCVTACTARIRPSSENGSRSSSEPPPRAITMTSTSGLPVEALDRLDHLGRRPRALHRGVRHLEADRRPAARGVVDDVALGGGLRRRDQPDAAGEEGQRPLELGREQPLGGQQLPAALETGEQLAEPDHPDLAGLQRQGAAVGVERRLGVDDHAGALDQRRVEAVEQAARARDGHRDVGDRVAQGHEDRLHAGRRVTWAIWPSTQTLPSRSIHDEIALAICRTGAGWVGEVSRATAVSLRVGADSRRGTAVSTSPDHTPT